MNAKEKAIQLLKSFKGDNYLFGLNVLDQIGAIAAGFGKTVLVIGNEKIFSSIINKVTESLEQNGVKLAGECIAPDAAPNAPREDVYRLESYILHYHPDSIIVIGGGSSIDAAKAANILATLGTDSPEIESYFGINLVSEALKRTGKKLLPLIAVQTAASSGAHLTKYSNITDPVAGQKKLIVDEANVPAKAIFDYAITESMPTALSIDGALDGRAHCLEVFFGANQENFEKIKEIALTGIELVVQFAAPVIKNPHDLQAREALGLATDLGGYAIMAGGTSGPHLTSFSLVDVTSHGRACGIMNPYYTVFFAPAIEKQLRLVGRIFKEAGFITSDLEQLRARELGVAVAEGMIAFSKSIQFPAKLSELPGFNDEHIQRALTAAKNPQLEMKLKNMPVPLNASLIDEYMAPILEAAKTGDFSLIRNMK